MRAILANQAQGLWIRLDRSNLLKRKHIFRLHPPKFGSQTCRRCLKSTGDAQYKILSLSDSCVFKVTQMHYTVWPDHGVPKYPQSMANFAKQILEIETSSPIVVHCRSREFTIWVISGIYLKWKFSAGVGRTGTFILIDSALRSAKQDGQVNLLAMLAHMRMQRPNMVDNDVSQNHF